MAQVNLGRVVGYSAYEVAVQEGFVGTEQEWLASLKGDTGNTGPTGADGADGTTFTPSVSAEGIISWTNDGGKPNPTSVNIKGPQGIQGPQGPAGTYTEGTGIDIDNGVLSVDTTVVALKSDLGDELPPIASGDAGKVLKVNAGETAVEWANDASQTYTGGTGIDITNNVISVDNTIATKSELFSGDYDDLTDKPDLSVYAESSDLATVATSGSYNDLTNRPTIPAVLSAGNGIDISNDEISVDDSVVALQYMEDSEQGTSTGINSIGVELAHFADANGNIDRQANMDAGGVVLSSYEYDETNQEWEPSKNVYLDVYDGVGFSDEQENITKYLNMDANGDLTWDGDPVALASDIPAAELPAITSGDAGKVLKVNSGETGVEWATVGGGSSGMKMIYSSSFSDGGIATGMSNDDKQLLVNFYNNFNADNYVSINWNNQIFMPYWKSTTRNCIDFFNFYNDNSTSGFLGLREQIYILRVYFNDNGGTVTVGSTLSREVKLSSDNLSWTGTSTSLTTQINSKQDTLTAGTGISITNNVISATGGGSVTDPIEFVNDDQQGNVYSASFGNDGIEFNYAQDNDDIDTVFVTQAGDNGDGQIHIIHREEEYDSQEEDNVWQTLKTKITKDRIVINKEDENSVEKYKAEFGYDSNSGYPTTNVEYKTTEYDESMGEDVTITKYTKLAPNSISLGQDNGSAAVITADSNGALLINGNNIPMPDNSTIVVDSLTGYMKISDQVDVTSWYDPDIPYQSYTTAQYGTNGFANDYYDGTIGSTTDEFKLDIGTSNTPKLAMTKYHFEPDEMDPSIYTQTYTERTTIMPASININDGTYSTTIMPADGGLEINYTGTLVGHKITIDIPPCPTTSNGTFTLQCVVSNGVASYSWVSSNS